MVDAENDKIKMTSNISSSTAKKSISIRADSKNVYYYKVHAKKEDMGDHYFRVTLTDDHKGNPLSTVYNFHIKIVRNKALEEM